MSQWVPCHNGGTHRNSWCAQVGSTAIDAQEEGITVPCPDFLREWMRVTVVGEFFFGIFWLFEFHGFSMVFMELRRTGDGRLGLPMTAWNMKFVEGCGVQASKEWGKKMITTCHRMSSPFQLSLLVWLWHVMKTLPSSHSVSVSRHGLHSSISVCFRWLKIGRNCINKNAFGRLNGNFSTCVHFQSSRHHSSRHTCDCWVIRRPWVKWTGHVGEL